MRLFMILFASIFILFASYGCEKESIPPSPKTKASKAEKVEIKPEAMIQEMVQETSKDESGYIYKSGGRRDPFVPLIVPAKEMEITSAKLTGTLQGYDINDFKLIAVAKKGPQYYALIATPDNKSFTVNKGTIIGLRKGKVKKITSSKLIMVEYSKDYRGELKARQIVLELHKGGGE